MLSGIEISLLSSDLKIGRFSWVILEGVIPIQCNHKGA